MIFVGDLNLIFDKNLESAGGSPLLKKPSLSEIIKLNENFNLCDIWRMRKPHKKLSKKNISLVLFSKDLIIFSFLTVHRNQLKKQKLYMLYHPIIFPFSALLLIMTLLLVDQVFGNSLLHNTEFVKKLKTHIEIVKSNLQENSSFSDNSKCEFLKYKVRKFSIPFSKNLTKTEWIIQTNLENRIKTLEQNLKNEEDFYAYNLCKLELENIYDIKAEDAKIRSKCEWYQYGEKPTKFFLNLEKQKSINTTVRHLIDDKKDIADLEEINACICKFYKNLFKKRF